MNAEFFQLRMGKNCPQVPAMIARLCQCTVNGGDAQAEHPWRDTCDRFPDPTGIIHDGKDDPGRAEHIRTYGHPITKAKYDEMVAKLTWDRLYAPNSIGANPYQPITDQQRHKALLTAPLPFSSRS